MLTRENLENLLTRGGNVIGSDGEKIGSIGQLYADDDTGEPTWVTVNTGLFGTSKSFLPIEGARIDGDDLVVPFTKDHVTDAPRVETDGHLEPEEEDRLYAHYDRSTRTYSEARTDEQATGRVKLRNYVTTENVPTDVPVDEEVRNERIETDGVDDTRR